jgi:hypothetical protein
MSEQRADDNSELQPGATELVKALGQQPEAAQTLHAILRAEVVERAPDSQTMVRLNWSLAQIIGTDAALFLARYLSDSDPDRLLELVDNADAEIELRRMQAFFGRATSDAMRQFDQNPDDWSDLYREVYFDVVRNQWGIYFTIEKFNGERMRIAADPDSLAGLARGIVRALNLIQDPDAVTTKVVHDVADDFSIFADRFGRDEVSGQTAGKDHSETAVEPASVEA